MTEQVATLLIRIDISLERAETTVAPAATVEPAALTAVPDEPSAPTTRITPAASASRSKVELGPIQGDVLAWLSDHNGTVSDPTGACTRLIARDLGRAINQVSGVIQVLSAHGFVTRDTRGKRTYQVTITDSGRDAIGRLAPWVRTNRARREARTAPRPTVVMPQPGPIARAPFNPDTARDSAANTL